MRVSSISRQETISALVGVHALILGVDAKDLDRAIYLTDRDRLETLVTVEGALACSWQTGGAW